MTELRLLGAINNLMKGDSMKTLAIMADTHKIMFVVNEKVVSLTTFLKAKDKYEPCDYTEKVCKLRIMSPNNKFRKDMHFSKFVEMNSKLIGKDFINYLGVLQDYGFKVTKSGIAYMAGTYE